jgi:hypothetical protein
MIFTSKPVRRVSYFPASPIESEMKSGDIFNCLQVHISVQKGFRVRRAVWVLTAALSWLSVT